MAFHHQPSRSEAPTLGPLTAVHVANVLEHELSESKIIGCEPKLDLDHLAALGLQDRIGVWREQIVRMFQPDDE